MEWDQLKRVFNHQVKDHFPGGIVQRAELLRCGEDPAIEPGQLLVRVFIPAPDGGADYEAALAEWEQAHRDEMAELRREVSLRLPSARIIEFTFEGADAPRITMADDGSQAGEQMSGREIVAAALALLRANYVFPDLAEQVAAAVEARMEAGEYDNLDVIALTNLVTTHLQEASDDRHLALRLGGGPRRPERDPREEPEEPKDHEARRLAMRQRGRLDNFGIRRVERLDGNVGYLDVRRVGMPAFAGPAISAAMELVAGTYALIIDLRRNGGGAVEGVVFWCSYLFGEKPVHLNDIFHADTGETRAVLGAALRAGDAVSGPARVRAVRPAHVLRRRGLLLHAAGAGPGDRDRRADRRRRAPDPAVPDQPRGAHRGTVRAFDQPGHRHQLAGHRRRARCRRAGGAGLRRRVRAGAAARADP